jgi:hypothetical protein
MQFSTPHDLLVYLFEVNDDPERTPKLLVGQDPLDLVEQEGEIDREDRADRGLAAPAGSGRLAPANSRSRWNTATGAESPRLWTKERRWSARVLPA